jgi:hypothetical protein
VADNAFFDRQLGRWRRDLRQGSIVPPKTRRSSPPVAEWQAACEAAHEPPPALVDYR